MSSLTWSICQAHGMGWKVRPKLYQKCCKKACLKDECDTKRFKAVPTEEYFPVHPAPVFFWMTHMYTNHWREMLQPKSKQHKWVCLIGREEFAAAPCGECKLIRLGIKNKTLYKARKASMRDSQGQLWITALNPHVCQQE